MSLQEVSLFGLSGVFAIAAPSFLLFRKRMSMEKNPDKHTRKSMIRFMTFNLFLNSIAYFGFMLMFIGTLTKPGVQVTLPVVLISSFFLLASAITFYGCGIYITAVIIESLMPKQFKKIPYLRRPFSATNMLHGPISHIIIFSGFIVAGALLSILDLMTGPTLESIPRLFLIGGAILGLSMGYSQIINGSAPFHTITGIVCAIALFVIDKIQGWNFTESLIGVYMLSFIATFLILNVYYFTFHWKWKNLWNRSGYREYS